MEPFKEGDIVGVEFGGIFRYAKLLKIFSGSHFPYAVLMSNGWHLRILETEIINLNHCNCRTQSVTEKNAIPRSSS
ncbi:MAG TPA: hypothetical protein VN040_05795 [Pseudosphingobacterium sp.]|nr:hypothetical protein [Pseudosphingobacterium sp.]